MKMGVKKWCQYMWWFPNILNAEMGITFLFVSIRVGFSIHYEGSHKIF